VLQPPPSLVRSCMYAVAAVSPSCCLALSPMRAHRRAWFFPHHLCRCAHVNSKGAARRTPQLDWLQRFHRASPSPRFSGYRSTTLPTTVTSSPPSIPLYPAVTLSLPLDMERPLPSCCRARPASTLGRASSRLPASRAAAWPRSSRRCGRRRPPLLPPRQQERRHGVGVPDDPLVPHQQRNPTPRAASSRGPSWRTPTPPRWSPPRRTGGTGAPAGRSRRRPPLLPVPPNPAARGPFVAGAAAGLER
jgi:hypothetical protein